MFKNEYFKYDSVSIKEGMATTPALPSIPEPPKNDTLLASVKNNGDGSQITDSSGSTPNLLPESYVLPVIDEKSVLLDDVEFNMLRVVINRIKKVDPALMNPFDISAVIRLEIQTPQYTDIINNADMTIKQKIEQIQKIMAMELAVVSDSSYKKNPYYMTNKSIFDDLMALNNTIPLQPKPTIANTTLK